MMTQTTLKKTALSVLVLSVLVSGGAYVWHGSNQPTSSGTHGAETASTAVAEAPDERGQHGGKLFRNGDFTLELKIFEEGVEPQLRLYAYQNDQLIPSQQWRATAKVQRLDTAETIGFQPEADYLLGDQVIYEPHSFVVTINVSHAGKTYPFTWTQLEGRVRLSQASVKSSGLEILNVEPKPLAVQQQYSGALQLIPNQQALVTASSTGTIKRVFKTVGQAVRQGEVVALLESRELISLRSQRQSLLQQLQLAQTNLKREERLWKEKVAPEQDYLN
ncbi:MAG: efflux transporter periplasmic adaptor subunit, partial [Moraxellaceae bacterium]